MNLEHSAYYQRESRNATICSSFKDVPTKEIYRKGFTHLLYEHYYDDVHNNRVWLLILDTPQKHKLIEQFKKGSPVV